MDEACLLDGKKSSNREVERQESEIIVPACSVNLLVYSVLRREISSHEQQLARFMVMIGRLRYLRLNVRLQR